MISLRRGAENFSIRPYRFWYLIIYLHFGTGTRNKFFYILTKEYWKFFHPNLQILMIDHIFTLSSCIEKNRHHFSLYRYKCVVKNYRPIRQILMFNYLICSNFVTCAALIKSIFHVIKVLTLNWVSTFMSLNLI